jgi:hypothetical protein
METELHWIHSTPQGFRIAFLQGFFESGGEVDASTMTLQATVLPWYVQDILRLLRELEVEPVIVDVDPPTIAVGLREAARIPLLSPIVKNGKYYEAASLSSGGRQLRIRPWR